MTKKWTAQVQVKWTKEAPVWENWDWLSEWSEVKWAASTMGEWDMTLWVDVQTPEALENFVHKKLWDKKNTIKEKDIKREMNRELSNR